MARTAQKNHFVISPKEYFQLLELLKKLEEVLAVSKKGTLKAKSLYGIWKGIQVNEEDFQAAKKSLFKSSL